MDKKEDKIFKKCSYCSTVWNTREDFLSDPSTVIIGYDVNFDDLDLGLFYFNHVDEKCRTTFVLNASYFRDLHNGQIYSERLTQSNDCPGYCLYKDNLEKCPAKCECAYIRDLIKIIKEWNHK